MDINLTKKIYANISAIGGYVPENKRTNHDLELITDTSDEWIVKRTGIKERRILDEGLATSDMAVNAIKNLIETYNKDINDVDAIIVATSTPDMLMPSTANIICGKLGIENVWAFDINAACSGFLYALDMGASLVETNRYKNVLVVGADKISAYVNINDRSTNILFGDGAGVVWLEPTKEVGVIDALLLSNGTGKEFLNIEGGGSLYPPSQDSLEKEKTYIKQDGKVVFKNAINAMSHTCLDVLAKNHLSVSDINWLVPHQANKRIIDAVGKEINIEENKTLINIEHYGNTIAATIPLCIWENTSKLKKGDLLMLTAFGAGFSWGASLLRWTI
ncbi:beta-ketoacyl-ACP synthase III [Chishuiella sp.]|uniref:beta-ketoacyl-ACP synthase III n=1 Tax=Chishuiella sp. TaxID=1969467 RepID=UPI0028B0ABAD|nr:beta-ketoacyl-ACP synthase III [Chishuiella sp.]